MSTLVLDASVAVKFAFPMPGEPLVDEAVSLFDAYRRGKTELLVPGVFWAELGNVAWKGVRQRRWSRAVAETAISELQAENFPTMPSRLLVQEAIAIALNYDRSVYDSLYIALAISTGSTMISADERLVRAVGGHFPVKWLGTLT